MRRTVVVLLVLSVASTVGAIDLLYVYSSEEITAIGGTVYKCENRVYYQGIHELTEAEFMLVAGYDASEANQFHTKNRNLWNETWAWIGGGVGLLLIGAPVVTILGARSTVVAATMFASAAIFTSAGVLSLSLVPLFRLILRGNYHLSLHQAELIAAEYNATLKLP